MTADDIITTLNLQPHPEGGWYRQIYDSADGERSSVTSIYFLLKAGERSHWHRVDAAEIWNFHGGAPLELAISGTAEGPARTLTLGSRITEGEQPQGIVPPGHWQSARSLGDYSLVGCAVAPGFRFEGFELAEAGFDIPRA